METVQLQCGHCQNLIGIRVEHLGMQVQCPHCRGTVQTPTSVPTPTPSAPEPPAPASSDVDLNRRESIFAGAEESDSVIGEQAGPKVELPSSANGTSSPSLPDTSAPATDFGQFKKKPAFDKSVLPLLALIFLVPYALLTTGLIFYLLLAQTKAPHPFDYMRDPVPNKGGPRGERERPVPTQALAEHQKTKIGSTITVGDLQVTPQHVYLTSGNELKLLLLAKNVAKKTKFEPMNEAFVKHASGQPLPYTFVEMTSDKVDKIDNIYGAYLAYQKGLGDPLGTAVLAPKEEVTIVLTTTPNYQKHVQRLTKMSDENFTWRVQVRRGFVKVDDKDVSATTVIGVDFTSADIEREKS